MRRLWRRQEPPVNLYDAASIEATEYALQDAWLADLEARVTALEEQAAFGPPLIWPQPLIYRVGQLELAYRFETEKI